MKFTIMCIILIFVPTIAYTMNNALGGKSQTDLYLVPIAMGLLGTSLIAAHIAAPESYIWNKNTISELASQNYKFAWIMRSGFIGFGSLISIAATWDLFSGSKHWSQTIPLIIYGSSIALSGIFSTAPFEQGVVFSENEAKIHSIFANVAGIALTGSMLGSAITENDPKLRIMHISGVAFVVLSSALFKISPENQGVWQRILWIGVFLG